MAELPWPRAPRSARYLRPVSLTPRAVSAPGRPRERPARERRVPDLALPPATAAAAPKTERWRETGTLRWPPIAEGEPAVERVEVTPLRQASKEPQRLGHWGNWQGELWMRSLRKPGLFLQDPMFAESSIGAKELHEEWGDVLPMSRRRLERKWYQWETWTPGLRETVTWG
eukprot:s90_g41.t1